MGKRAHWGDRLGFILAAAGSAIGLGNIWKFPYITGEHGGGAFVLVYLGCILLVGLPIIIAEIYFGKKTQKSPVGAFKAYEPETDGVIHYHRKDGSIRTPYHKVGWFSISSGIIILSFYSIVAGWACHYLMLSITQFNQFSGSKKEISGVFGALYQNASYNLLWHTVIIGVTIWIVSRGVQKGIEQASKILMPILALILVGLMIYGLTLSGGMKALSFMFYPDFSKLNPEAIIQALGHSFFTLSLGMGVMITYGSYLKKETNILSAGITIAILDTVIALVAGVAIFSIVFTFGLSPEGGPSLIFKTLPFLFGKIPGGQIIAIFFFLLLVFAALTSALSLLEVVVSYFIDERSWSRRKATLVFGGFIYLLGVLSAIPSLKIFGETFLDFFDNITTKYFLPIGGLLTILVFAYSVKGEEIREELKFSKKFYMGFSLMIKTVTPALLLFVILNKMGVF